MRVAPAGVRVNGQPLCTGIRVLQDRDELYVDGLGRAFFSAERRTCVVPFAAAARPATCPRCKQVIVEHAAAVQCPQCRIWYHQSDELPCWQYAERCALCDQSTAMEAGFRWSPVDL
jgi:hypothetical protein